MNLPYYFSDEVVGRQKFVQNIEFFIHEMPYNLDFVKSDSFLPRTVEMEGVARSK